MNTSSSTNSFAVRSSSVVAAPGAVGGRVEPEVADLELGRPLGRRPAGERPQPREQLAEGERLDEVVVGARVETLDPVLDRVARGQHQHRRPDAAGAQLAAGGEAVDPRQHHVEDDRVVGRRAGHPERLLAGRGEIGRMALLAEAAHEQAAELRLVLDDQDAHR